MPEDNHKEFEKLLGRAARYCSSAERCTGEVKDKLLLWGMEQEHIEGALEQLKAQQFIDDERFAGFFVQDKLHLNKWGRVKIAHALRHKKLDDTIIQQALKKLDQDRYMEILRELLSAKIKSVGSLRKNADKARVIRFAAQRGFTSEEIYSTLDRLEES